MYVEIKAQIVVLRGIKPYPAFTPDTRIMKAETSFLLWQDPTTTTVSSDFD